MRQEELITEIKMPKFLGGKGKITPEDLHQAWQQAGKPQEVEGIVQILQQAGMKQKQVIKTLQSVGVNWEPPGGVEAAKAEETGAEEKDEASFIHDKTFLKIQRLVSFLDRQQKYQLAQALQQGEPASLGGQQPTQQPTQKPVQDKEQPKQSAIQPKQQ